MKNLHIKKCVFLKGTAKFFTNHFSAGVATRLLTSLACVQDALAPALAATAATLAPASGGAPVLAAVAAVSCAAATPAPCGGLAARGRFAFARSLRLFAVLVAAAHIPQTSPTASAADIASSLPNATLALSHSLATNPTICVNTAVSDCSLLYLGGIGSRIGSRPINLRNVNFVGANSPSSTGFVAGNLLGRDVGALRIRPTAGNAFDVERGGALVVNSGFGSAPDLTIHTSAAGQVRLDAGASLVSRIAANMRRDVGALTFSVAPNRLPTAASGTASGGVAGLMFAGAPLDLPHLGSGGKIELSLSFFDCIPTEDDIEFILEQSFAVSTAVSTAGLDADDLAEDIFDGDENGILPLSDDAYALAVRDCQLLPQFHGDFKTMNLPEALPEPLPYVVFGSLALIALADLCRRRRKHKGAKTRKCSPRHCHKRGKRHTASKHVSGPEGFQKLFPR
jgi:hypothetical protein